MAFTYTDSTAYLPVLRLGIGQVWRLEITSSWVLKELAANVGL